VTRSRRANAGSSDLADVSEQARRLLRLVDRGELVADDAAGRRVVEAWRVLAAGAGTSKHVAPISDPDPSSFVG
jgi:hypothetical protein